jgi:hypothetical protein
MECHRVGIKFFAADPAAVRLQDFIPIFHSWIQKQNLPGHLLIDIHDYSHIHEGPGILLVAHEGNFSIDTTEGRPGLLYYRKAPTALPPVDHLITVFRSALQGRHLLETDAGLRFLSEEMLVIANDRLAAPNNEETFLQFRPVVTVAIERVFEKSPKRLARTQTDPKERLAVRIEL